MGCAFDSLIVPGPAEEAVRVDHLSFAAIGVAGTPDAKHWAPDGRRVERWPTGEGRRVDVGSVDVHIAWRGLTVRDPALDVDRVSS